MTSNFVHIFFLELNMYTRPQTLLEHPKNEQWQKTNMVKIEARATQNT